MPKIVVSSMCLHPFDQRSDYFPVSERRDQTTTAVCKLEASRRHGLHPLLNNVSTTIIANLATVTWHESPLRSTGDIRATAASFRKYEAAWYQRDPLQNQKQALAPSSERGSNPHAPRNAGVGRVHWSPSRQYIIATARRHEATVNVLVGATGLS